MPSKMGNCVSDSTHKYVEADNEKITLIDNNIELQGLMEKLLERCGNGGVVMMNFANKLARSVQGKGKGDNNNNRLWRLSLEDIHELFTEE
jgi:hypothetical protein